MSAITSFTGRRGLKLLSIFPVAGCLAACSGPLYSTAFTPTLDSSNNRFLLAYFTKVKTYIAISVPIPTPTEAGKPPPPPSVTIAALNKPSDKQYLYFHPDSLYSSSAEFSVDINGLPSKSDTSSAQQLGAILTEAAQAATGLATMSAVSPPKPVVPVAKPTAQDCVTALSDQAPYAGNWQVTPTPTKILTNASVAWWVFMDASDATSGDQTDPTATTPVDGFYVYEPSIVRVTLACFAVSNSSPTETDQPIAALPTQGLSAYIKRMKVSPTRDFWTNPQDTYTITGGVLVSHKYVDQSGAKTFVDIITSPIRAILPSVSTQTSTQVQTSDGKPTATTQTTQVTVGPPKSP